MIHRNWVRNNVSLIVQESKNEQQQTTLKNKKKEMESKSELNPELDDYFKLRDTTIDH